MKNLFKNLYKILFTDIVADFERENELLKIKVKCRDMQIKELHEKNECLKDDNVTKIEHKNVIYLQKEKKDDEDNTYYTIKNIEDGEEWEFTIKNGVYQLDFAMCTYGHPDFIFMNNLNDVIEYISKNDYVGGFGKHICRECYIENVI